MPEYESVYTYRGGRRVALNKEPDQFVARALPERLRQAGIADAATDVEQVSSASTRVETLPGELEAMMKRSREIAPTHHAYTRADSGQEFLITDRVLVSFKRPLSVEELGAFAGKYGLRQLEAYSDRDFLFALTKHTGMNPVKLVVKLTEEEKDLVALAENDLNYRAHRAALVLPTDPAYTRQWHLHALNPPHADVDARAHARCEAAWQRLDSYGSHDVVVGVTDDGCKLDHLDFDGSDKFAGWGYFQGTQLVQRGDINAQPSRMHIAGDDHGTSCCGVIAGEADAILTVGAAPGCRLWPVRWEVTPEGYLAISDSKMMTMLGQLGDKVDVLSNSWGGAPVSNWGQVVVNRIRQLAQNGGRRGRGIVFLWAAGNENCPIQHTATVDVPFTMGWAEISGAWEWVGVETARVFENNLVGVPGVMHVAALASTAQRSHYSNYGTGISLCAPSSNSHEYHRLPVRGLDVTTTTGQTGGVTDDFGGTSSATPLTAGVAALVISADPALTALEVVSILQRTAAKDLDMQGYPRTPSAPFDANTAWDVSPIAPFASGAFQNNGAADGTWSPWFGHGRVDAYAAVAEANRRADGGGGDGSGGQTIRQSSAPALAIPDNQSTGVRDTINVAAVARIGAIKVTVDITHPYRGDLRVLLIAPWGEEVVLHGGAGRDADDLKRSFDRADTPGLDAWKGRPTNGNWTLLVRDVARADIGDLNRWELELVPQTQAIVTLEDQPDLLIPDKSPAGIERVLNTAQTGRVQSAEVSVNIEHDYIGDLSLSLVAPDGTRVPLYEPTGDDSDDLVSVFTSATTPALLALQGRPITGNWRLQVADLVARDEGRLKRWGLKIVSTP